MSLTLKLVTDDGTYRLPLTRPTKYHAVVQAVIDYLGPNAASLVEGSLLLKYFDEEGDLCVLTAASFNDFLRLQGGLQAKVLKLILAKSQKVSAPSSLQQDFSDTANKKDHRISCDGLSAGLRTSRNERLGYDLRSTCYDWAHASQMHGEESFSAFRPEAPQKRCPSGKSGHEGLDAVLTLAEAAVSARDQPNFLGALAAGLTLGALAASKGPKRCDAVANLGLRPREDAKAGSETEGVLQHEGQAASNIPEQKLSNKESASLAWSPAWEDLNQSNAKKITGSADVKHKMWMRLKAGLEPEKRADEITQMEAASVMQAAHQGTKFKGTFSIVTKKHPTTPFAVEAELWLSNTRVWHVNTCRILKEESKPKNKAA